MFFNFVGAAMGVSRGTVAVMVKPHESYQELYDEMFNELQSMPIPVDIKSEYIMPQRNV